MGYHKTLADVIELNAQAALFVRFCYHSLRKHILERGSLLQTPIWSEQSSILCLTCSGTIPENIIHPHLKASLLPPTILISANFLSDWELWSLDTKQFRAWECICVPI